jgi:DAK2 domain fusion protein YloV
LSAAAAASGEIKFGYCTEFFIQVKNVSDEKERAFKTYLESIGDSIVAVSDEELIKIHVHTNHPGQVLEKAIAIGPLSNLKIENMRLQHTSMINFSAHSQAEAQEPEKPYKDVGFAAVSLGDGLKELFLNLGADVVIEGGQTMNPSSENIIKAAESINAGTIFILPNNKNIILVAEQAAKMKSDKKLVVLPTKSIPQGVTCLVSYSPGYSIEENEEAMRKAMGNTHSGQITSAVRNTVNNGMDIAAGDLLGIIDGKIEVVEKTIKDAAEQLVKRLADPGVDVVSIYYGADADKDEAEALGAFAKTKFPQTEVEILYGGQPIYYYIISAE